MKIALLVAGSRAGAEFFQSMLDGHPQIAQFPGEILLNNKFFYLFTKKSNEIPKLFVKSYPHFFNSRLNKIERHDKLGARKNKFFKVSAKKFEKNFHKYMKKFFQNKKISKIDILKCLHLSYFNNHLNEKKLIVINIHLVECVKKFIKFFNYKKFDILHTIRHPYLGIISPTKNWTEYENGKYFLPNSAFFQINLVVNSIKELTSAKINTYILQLEVMHKFHKIFFKDFCKIYKIKYKNKIFEKTTFNQLQWWGDEISNKYLTGINKNFQIKLDDRYLPKNEQLFFGKLMQKYCNYYNYKIFLNSKTKNILFFPLKIEIFSWINALKNKRLLALVSIPFFYIKRLFLINNFFQKKIKYPYSIGNNKKLLICNY